MMLLIAVINENAGNLAVTFRRVECEGASPKEFGLAAELQRASTLRLQGLADPLAGPLEEMTPEEIEAAGLPPLDVGESPS